MYQLERTLTAKAVKEFAKEVAEKGHTHVDAFMDTVIKFKDTGADFTRDKETINGLPVKKRRPRRPLKEFLSACEFVTYVTMGHSYMKAYRLTFPDRVKKNSKHRKTQEAGANMYTRTALVSGMLLRIQLHNHILFMDRHYEALKRMYEMGMDRQTEPKTASYLLDKFVTHTKKPENVAAGVQVHVNVESTALDSIEAQLKQLADLSTGKIVNGELTAKQLAHTGRTATTRKTEVDDA